MWSECEEEGGGGGGGGGGGVSDPPTIRVKAGNTLYLEF